MLHYNYSTSLTHFLNYHQLEDQQVNDNETITNTNTGTTSSTTTTTTSNVYCDDFLQHEDIRCRSNSSSTTSNNKSFTIAAILGLKNDKQTTLSSPSSSSVSSDMGAVNLTVHQTGTDRATLLTTCNRLQLPVRHHNNSSTVGLTTTTTTTPGGGHYTVGHGCPTRQTVRGLKHLQSTVVHSNKKSCKGKRVRTIFTPEQLERLEAEFERQQYMVGPERLYLAHTLQLTEAQVKVWFQNRRIKWRKHHLELTHQRLAVLKQQQLLLDETHADVQDTNSSTSTDT